MLRDLNRSEWLSWLNLPGELVPQALLLRGTRNLKRHYVAHQEYFEDIVHVDSPNGLFEDVFVGRFGDTRVGYASVYGAAMASEIVHVFGVLGTRLVIQTGCCGALAPELHVGDLFVAEEAHCGEGAAQYYRRDAARVRASIPFDRWRGLPGADSATLARGSIFTTAALLAEGADQLAAWRAGGFDAVDMETATTFAVAEHFGMERASILFVFDNPRHSDHMLAGDSANAARRPVANQRMIELALAMIARWGGQIAPPASSQTGFQTP